MTYDEFKQAWIAARRESGLPLLSAHEGKEALDLRFHARTFETVVEPVGGQQAEPFHVAAALAWRWDALHTARSATTEDDMLTEMFGRERAAKAKTERPRLRVDVSMRASLPWGKAIPMPTPSAWTKWAREVHGRLEDIEPLVPEKTSRATRDGLEVLGWQTDPVARVVCGPDGELKLEAVEIAAGQIIELPRQWDDRDRRPDPTPGAPLRDLFTRVRAALNAWMQAVDHLTPRGRR